MEKNILVCVQDYPNLEGGIKLMYVHTRNLEYMKRGINVTVLNFSAHTDYKYEGIRVITLNTYKSEKNNYNIILLHAANLKNHYIFLKKYGNNFDHFIFFFHGHEVLRINSDYSTPYSFVKRNKLKVILQDIYDELKLLVWRRYLLKVIEKTDLIFVSNWMLEMFLKNIKIPKEKIENIIHITYNSVGLLFEKEVYVEQMEKEYDFITIRANLDDSKYAVDIVNKCAKYNPNMNFLVIGKGELFKYIEKSENIVWLDRTLHHSEILDYLNKARYALMPTRIDAQGLMMCEMAAFGIPVITSNIPVCHEVFDGFENVFFIDNDKEEYDLSQFKERKSHALKDDSYFMNNTIMRELEIIRRVQENT